MSKNNLTFDEIREVGTKLVSFLDDEFDRAMSEDQLSEEKVKRISIERIATRKVITSLLVKEED